MRLKIINKENLSKTISMNITAMIAMPIIIFMNAAGYFFTMLSVL